MATTRIRKFTDLQKLAIFKYALTIIIEHMKDGYYFSGLCSAIYKATKATIPNNNSKHGVNAFEEMEKYFPEIWKYKPNKNYSYWFGLNLKGTTKRIQILRNEILALERKIKKKKL
jgi:Gpi18-like mannosyltransferase